MALDPDTQAWIDPLHDFRNIPMQVEKWLPQKWLMVKAAIARPSIFELLSTLRNVTSASDGTGRIYYLKTTECCQIIAPVAGGLTRKSKVVICSGSPRNLHSRATRNGDETRLCDGPALRGLLFSGDYVLPGTVLALTLQEVPNPNHHPLRLITPRCRFNLQLGAGHPLVMAQMTDP